MSTYEEYYSNYGNLSVEEYVDKYLRNSDMEKERMNQLLKLIPEDTETLLDIGAGHGLFLEKLMHERGIEGTGIEITKAKVDYGISIGIDMRIGNAAQLEFESNSFDVVVCFEVLEHLPFEVYEKAVQEIKRVAKSMIIIGVPNNEKRVFIECPYCGSSTNSSWHLRSFDDNCMVDLFTDFSMKKLIHIGDYMKSWLTYFPIKRKYSWPNYLVCPSCGYRKENKENSVMSSVEFRENFIKNIIKKIIPKFKAKRWLIAVYEKNHKC